MCWFSFVKKFATRADKADALCSIFARCFIKSLCSFSSIFVEIIQIFGFYLQIYCEMFENLQKKKIVKKSIWPRCQWTKKIYNQLKLNSLLFSRKMKQIALIPIHWPLTNYELHQQKVLSHTLTEMNELCLYCHLFTFENWISNEFNAMSLSHNLHQLKYNWAGNEEQKTVSEFQAPTHLLQWMFLFWKYFCFFDDNFHKSSTKFILIQIKEFIFENILCSIE